MSAEETTLLNVHSDLVRHTLCSCARTDYSEVGLLMKTSAKGSFDTPLLVTIVIDKGYVSLKVDIP